MYFSFDFTDFQNKKDELQSVQYQLLCTTSECKHIHLTIIYEAQILMNYVHTFSISFHFVGHKNVWEKYQY